ncbi:MAG: hypothetical protein U5P41_15965 [Gammaproteobacteria bacterium]|nr:hypothetical protein [Gammaproteobacteria bacterium]
MEDATAADSLEPIDTLRDEPLPEAPCYIGVMFPDRVRKLLRRRVATERDRLRRSLSELEQRVIGDSNRENTKQNDEMTDAPKPGGQFSMAEGDYAAGERQVTPQLEYEGRRVQTPPDVRGLLTSIRQDLGEVPEDYPVTAGDTPYDADAESVPRFAIMIRNHCIMPTVHSAIRNGITIASVTARITACCRNIPFSPAIRISFSRHCRNTADR